MIILKVGLVAGAVLLGLFMRPANATDTSLQVTQIDPDDSCQKGLVVWQAYKTIPKCGMVSTPQAKIFDSAGRLRFIGSALDAIRWAKAGQPDTLIPDSITVRYAVSEARVTHVKAPPHGHAWVTYYLSDPCPPCETQLAMVRSDVLPKLGQGAGISVFKFAK